METSTPTGVAALPASSFKVDDTLGATFLGLLVATALWAITTVQTYTFYRDSLNDKFILTATVAVLWVLDSLHLAFIIHAIYHYAIKNYSNPAALLITTWSLSGVVFVTVFGDALVRCVFASRIYNLSKGNWLLLVLVVIPSFTGALGGLAFAIKVHQKPFTFLSSIAWLIYASLASTLIADAVIAVCMCYLLRNSKSDFTSTRAIINTLITYTINTGLLTIMAAAATFTAYAAMPHNLIFVAIYCSLSKLVLNAMLATLNARFSLLHKHHKSVAIPLATASQTGTNEASVGAHTSSLNKPEEHKIFDFAQSPNFATRQHMPSVFIGNRDLEAAEN